MRSLICIFLLVINFPLFSGDKVIGFWKTINDRKGFTTSVIAVYKFENKVYGQVIIAYDEKTGDLIDTLYTPKQHIDGKKENSYLCRSNLFWGLVWNGLRWTGGFLIDPRNGKVYHCQIWEEDGILILRGEWGFFGLNQLLLPAEPGDYPFGFIIPDAESFLPAIPEF